MSQHLFMKILKNLNIYGGFMEDNVTINSESPDVLTNNMYTPAFLRQQIGKLLRVEFLIRN